MSVNGDLVAALMQRVAELPGFAIAHPRKGGQRPKDEHVRVALLKNDNRLVDLDAQDQLRRGFLVLTLVSPLQAYQVEAEEKAGQISEHFPVGLQLTRGELRVMIKSNTEKSAREENARWETPVWVGFETIA